MSTVYYKEFKVKLSILYITDSKYNNGILYMLLKDPNTNEYKMEYEYMDFFILNGVPRGTEYKNGLYIVELNKIIKDKRDNNIPIYDKKLVIINDKINDMNENKLLEIITNICTININNNPKSIKYVQNIIKLISYILKDRTYANIKINDIEDYDIILSGLYIIFKMYINQNNKILEYMEWKNDYDKIIKWNTLKDIIDIDQIKKLLKII